MNLIEALTHIGLNEKEAKIYLALLQVGKATAYMAAKNCGLKRPTVYVILEALVVKGVVNKVPRTKVAHYVVVKPEELFAMAKNKLNDATKALPELKALSRGRLKKKVNVSYYEGIEGVREMYNKLCGAMKGREYVAFSARVKETPPELLKYFDELNEMHRKLDIQIRAVTVRHKSVIKYFKKEWQKKYKTKLKTLPFDKFDSSISIEVYRNFVQIISHRYLQGILIDNPDIAKVVKQIFELVWTREDCREVGKW